MESQEQETTFERPKGIRAKLCAMMGEIGYIEKRGQNTAQNYAYVQAADIAAVVARLCAKYGIAFWAEEEVLSWDNRQTSKGNAMFVCRASMKYVFADIDSEERITVPSTGEGMDTGDKAIYKAKTGALKYALIQTFLIATGDDPETESETHDLQATEEVKQKPPLKQSPEATVCPECGNAGAIIKGRPEYGGGWLCFKKKGGCGAQFRDDDSRFAGNSRDSVNGRDTDSNPVPISTERQKISEDQLEELEGWIKTFGVNRDAVIKQYRMSDPAVRELSDLTPEQFSHAAKVFASKRQRQAMN